MITVWGRRSSSYVQATLWCLAELGLEFERIDAGLHHGVTNTPEYLAMNPSGQVPTLVDGSDPPLFESSAIIRYLASRYGSAPFWPDEIVARSQIDKWLDWANINVAAFFERCVLAFGAHAARANQPCKNSQAAEKIEWGAGNRRWSPVTARLSVW